MSESERKKKSSSSSARKRDSTPGRNSPTPSRQGGVDEGEDHQRVKKPKRINMSTVATWITVISTLAFNIQFSYVYKNMQQAPLFNTLLTEYSDPRILDALDLIDDFARQNVTKGDPYAYAYHFLDLKTKNDPLGKELDHARRMLISWYQKVQLFFEFKFLDSNYVDVLPGRNRVEFFMSVVEPLDILNRELSNRPTNPVFNYFRNLYNLPTREKKVVFDPNRLSEECRAQAQKYAIRLEL